MAEDDERWRQHGSIMEGHDQLIPLKLPHLVGYGLNLKEGVALRKKQIKIDSYVNQHYWIVGMHNFRYFGL